MTSQSVEPRDFRRVMGQFPTGVVIVAAVTADGKPTGMSVGSFTSVSLEPPLVAFFPATTSTTWPLLEAAGCFCVNVLGADQEQLCRAFSRSGVDKFDGVTWRPAATGSPIIDGSLAFIDCELERVDQAGDHYIVLGAVREMEVQRTTVPLVFFQGGYGRFDAGAIVAGDRYGDLAVPLRVADIAREEMEGLAQRADAECIASALVEDEIVILAGAGPLDRRSSATLIGGRIPAVPPAGATFMAWEPPERVTRWAASEWSDDDLAHLEQRLASVREKGYALSVEGLGLGDWGAILSDATAESDRAELRSRIPSIMRHYDPPLGPEDAGHVRTIHMPVFGADGRVKVTMNVGSFGAVDSSRLASLVADVRATADRITSMIGGARPPHAWPVG